MKKIIFFSKNMNIGGMEKALVVLLNHLALKYDVTLVLEEKCGILLNDLSPKIKIKEYHLFDFNFSVLRKALNYLKRIIWTLFNKNKYDFSCSYATYSIICSRLALIASKNNSLYVHSNYYKVFDSDHDKVRCFFEELKINNFRNIIFVSKESSEGIKKVYPELSNSFTVINNLVDYESILEQSNKYDVDNVMNKNNINLLFLGRLDNDSKRLDVLINSFNEVIKINSSFKLFIIGKGKDYKMVLNLINSLKLNNYIKLIDETNNPYPYMKECDALILTSKYEGYPVIYNEAMVLNKKVITTIQTSDDEIDVSSIFTIIENDEDIVDSILKTDKSNIKYNIDFKKINDIRLKNISKIIEEEL